MKTVKSNIVVLFVLLTAQIASAYYCPSTGRWLSRDPISEPGFQVQRIAAQASAIVPGRWINRDSISDKSGLYGFVKNNSLIHYDILGLDCCATTKDLKDRYTTGANSLGGRNVPHGNEGDYSCININYNILLYMQQACFKCWTCRLEHRSRFVLILNQWYDHWAVVCKSNNTHEQALYDYWGDRPAGENPETWFRTRYPNPGMGDEGNDFYRNGQDCYEGKENPLDSIPTNIVPSSPPEGYPGM